MRIAVLFEFPNPQVGGAHSFITNYVKNIEFYSSEFSHEFVFVNSNSSVKFSSLNHSVLNLPVLKVPLRFRLMRKFLSFFGIYPQFQSNNYFRHQWDKVFRQNRIDFVWSLMPVRRPFSTPFATTIWDLDHLTQPYFPEFSLNQEWENRENDMRYSIMTAALVITGTHHTGKLLSTKYSVDEERIVISPFSIQPKPNLVTTRDKNLIYYPAQFWAHKNHINLLRALRLLLDRGNSSLQLVLSGSDKGSMQFVRREIEDLNLENNVRVLGFLTDMEVENLYRTAGVVAFPSFCGPDNLPPLESISFGAPASISDLPGLREHWGKAFYYFDPDSPESIAESIQLALKNGLTEEMLVQRTSLMENLTPLNSIEKVVRRVENLAARIANFSA